MILPSSTTILQSFNSPATTFSFLSSPSFSSSSGVAFLVDPTRLATTPPAMAATTHSTTDIIDLAAFASSPTTTSLSSSSISGDAGGGNTNIVPDILLLLLNGGGDIDDNSVVVPSLIQHVVDKFSIFSSPQLLVATATATATTDDQAATATAVEAATKTATAAASAIATSPFNLQVPSIITNIAIGLTAIIFVAAGLTYLTAAIMIPAGAQQLEQECKVFIPDRWEEYQSKLDDGQSIQDRPDLMFELGLILNGVKAENVRKIATTYYPDLWQKYSSMLDTTQGQELKDRPELIDQLSREIGKRSATQLRSVAPPELWEKYSTKASQTEAPLGSGMASSGQIMPLEDRADLLLELAQEMGYPDIFEAAAATETEDDRTASERTAQAIVDAEIVSKQQNQWDD